jgi:hypothetical protein
VFLGEDLLPLLVLAFGAAMAVGSIMAIVRPPERVRSGESDPAPLVRSLTFAAVGTVAAVWAIASLAS